MHAQCWVHCSKAAHGPIAARRRVRAQQRAARCHGHGPPRTHLLAARAARARRGCARRVVVPQVRLKLLGVAVPGAHARVGACTQGRARRRVGVGRQGRAGGRCATRPPPAPPEPMHAPCHALEAACRGALGCRARP
jgi:hypothetical protein